MAKYVFVYHGGKVQDDGGSNPASGYSLIEASGIEDAIEKAKGCPILKRGGNVEVAEAMDMQTVASPHQLLGGAPGLRLRVTLDALAASADENGGGLPHGADAVTDPKTFKVEDVASTGINATTKDSQPGKRSCAS